MNHILIGGAEIGDIAVRRDSNGRRRGPVLTRSRHDDRRESRGRIGSCGPSLERPVSTKIVREDNNLAVVRLRPRSHREKRERQRFHDAAIGAEPSEAPLTHVDDVNGAVGA